MFKRLLLVLGFVLAIAPFSQADHIIILKNGKVFHATYAEVKGDYVIFFIEGGKMSIELLMVDRIEEINETSARMPSLSGGISSTGSPANAGAAATAGRPASIGDSGELGAGTEENPNEDLIKYYIQQKQQIELNIAVAQEQIKTLNDVIYAKSAIFSDTQEERRKIQEYTRQIEDEQQRLSELYVKARKDGLTRGDIRRIEDAETDIVRNDITTRMP